MKKFFTFLSLLISLSGFSQHWNKIYSYNEYLWLWSDSVLHPPGDTLASAPNGSFAIKNIMSIRNFPPASGPRWMAEAMQCRASLVRKVFNTVLSIACLRPERQVDFMRLRIHPDGILTMAWLG